MLQEVTIIGRGEFFSSSFIHNILWMYPVTLMPLKKRPPSRHGVTRVRPVGECCNGMLLYITVSERNVVLAVYLCNLIMGAHAVLIQISLIWVFGLPTFPDLLYGIFFSSCVTIFYSICVISRTPSSWVPSFGRVWSAPKAAYDRVWSAGSKAWDYVLGIVRGA